MDIQDLNLNDYATLKLDALETLAVSPPIIVPIPEIIINGIPEKQQCHQVVVSVKKQATITFAQIPAGNVYYLLDGMRAFELFTKPLVLTHDIREPFVDKHVIMYKALVNGHYSSVGQTFIQITR